MIPGVSPEIRRAALRRGLGDGMPDRSFVDQGEPPLRAGFERTAELVERHRHVRGETPARRQGGKIAGSRRPLQPAQRVAQRLAAGIEAVVQQEADGIGARGGKDDGVVHRERAGRRRQPDRQVMMSFDAGRKAGESQDQQAVQDGASHGHGTSAEMAMGTPGLDDVRAAADFARGPAAGQATVRTRSVRSSWGSPLQWSCTAASIRRTSSTGASARPSRTSARSRSSPNCSCPPSSASATPSV